MKNIKLKDLLTEGEKVFEFNFSNTRDFEEAIRELNKAGWYGSGNGNPPSSIQLKNNLMFASDDRQNTITVGDDGRVKKLKNMLDKKKINYSVKSKKPYGYKVIDHGGYLD